MTSLNELRWEVNLLILVKLLTITQCIEMRCDFCWYWWICWPSLNEMKWGVIFVDIGGIVHHHSMSWSEIWFLLILVELLTSLNEFRREVIFVEIGGIVDHHSMNWGERWFLLILVEFLTIIQWVKVRGDFCWYWCNYWHHSMSWCERWFLLILVELLTITEWVKVRGDFCWYWWNGWPSLNELRWELIFVVIGEIVDHHSMYWDEMWFLLILVKLLTFIQWDEVRGDFCWYWWNCWPSLNELRWEVIFVDIGGIADHH